MNAMETGASELAQYAYVARYAYSDVVIRNDNFLMLSPYADRFQSPANGGCAVTTIPDGQQITYPDRLGNVVNRIWITSPHRELIIAATGGVCLHDPALSVEDAPLAALAYGPETREFLSPSRLVDPNSVRDATQAIAGDADTLLETVRRITAWIFENVRYQRGNTSVNTNAADVLASMTGVCQDMTHLALAMLRAKGVAARYVSGLLTRQPGETHAWLEFLHPLQGWLPADPTRGLMTHTAADYLKFAIGRDYSHVPPVSGTVTYQSRGAGQLTFVAAEVYFDRETMSADDAMALLENYPRQHTARQARSP